MSTIQKYILPVGMIIVLVVVTLITSSFFTVRAQDPSVSKIESDDPAVVRTGTWSSQPSAQASGGSYLYNAPSPINGDDVALSLQFSGPSIEILYVSGPNLGTMALEIDGVVLRTVITTAPQTAYQQSATIDYLTDEAHTLRVYAQAGGVIGVDAFRAVLPIQIVNEQSVRVGPPCNQSGYLHRVNEDTPGVGANWAMYGSYGIHLSEDGRYTAFTAMTSLVPETLGMRWTPFIYRLDNVTCEFQLVTIYSDGRAGSSEGGVMSRNGRYFVFDTIQPLSPLDTDEQEDLYVRDMESHTVVPFTLGFVSYYPSYPEYMHPVDISNDGRYILFSSDATNIVAGDNNEYDRDLFIYDMQTREYELVSTGNGHNETRSYSQIGAVSDDGRYVVFNAATGLVTDSPVDLFLRDRQLQTTTLITHDYEGAPYTSYHNYATAPKFSADGQHVSYMGGGCYIAPNVPNCNRMYVYIYDLTTHENSPAMPFPLPGRGYGYIDFHNYVPPYSISGNLRYIVFTHPVHPEQADYPDFDQDISIYDRETGIQELVTIPVSGDNSSGDSWEPTVSNDGRWVAFSTDSGNLMEGDGGMRDYTDLFLADRYATHSHTVLFATLVNYGRVDLTWRQFAPTPTQFEVERSADGGALWNTVGTIPVGDTTYQDSGLNCDTTYSYRFHALTPQQFYAEVSNVVMVHASPCHTDGLVLINPATQQIGMINTLADPLPSGAVTTLTTNARASGEWVMGDWDGDGTLTPGVYEASGAFMFTNDLGPTATWQGVWFGLLNRPSVAGRFDTNVNHDCLGVIDSANFPPFGTGYAAYFSCNLTSGPVPPLSVQWLGVPDYMGAAPVGVAQAVAGDFDGDGIDSFGLRYQIYFEYSTELPTVPELHLPAGFSLRPFGNGLDEQSILIIGDWNNDLRDEVGLLSQDGYFEYQYGLIYDSALFSQHIGLPIGTPVQAASWR